MQLKEKVEAIYPLSFLQQGLLFHSLQKDVDQGFLQVKCVLKGEIKLEAFEKAWRQNIQRHECLRTSLHWENLEKPVQVVHKEASLPFIFYDWSDNTESEQKARLEELLKSDAKIALDLNKAPVLRIFLIRLSVNEHFLLWDCHHILVDGWSGSIILQDLLSFYEAICSGEIPAALPAIPSYKAYLNWVKNLDLSKSKIYWTEVLRDFERPTLVADRKQLQKNFENNFQTKSLTVSQEESQKLRDFSQKNQITLNTLFQGIWALLLSRYVEQNDITFGTVVSGRSIDLPNAELMAGMFMNVLPLRVRIEKSENFSSWLKALQLQQAKTREFEYSNLDDILNSSDLAAKSNLWFDTLVVFENIPLENIRGGGVWFESFESSLSTTYALTLAVIPHKEIKAYLKYDTSMVSQQQISWMLRNLQNLIEIIIENTSNSLEELTKCITHLETQTPDQIEDTEQNKGGDYRAPRNDVELKLLSIWESLLNVQPISTTDDFFDLGGTSIVAIRLFTKIEKQFNRRLQPISLLKHRTIQALAELITDETKDEPWSSLVPLRTSGSKPPIFCLHAGGGHVFFYKDLAKHLGPDQPVYALQRISIDDVIEAPQTIETIASHYLKEIRKVQPTGSYSLLAYCFGNSICWEIARQLREAGDSLSLIAIIDSPPYRHDRRTSTEKITRILNKAKALDFSFIGTIWKGRVVKPVKTKLVSLREGKESDPEKIKQLKLNKTLELIYKSYNWRPLPIKVTLIKSSAWTLNPYFSKSLGNWSDLALDGVETYVVEGDHPTLFDEPEVQHLAKQLNQCLDNAHKLCG